MLGFSIEDEVNELQPLSNYAKEALDSNSVQGNMITFLDEAKRKEGSSDPLVDYVLTFQELKAVFVSKVLLLKNVKKVNLHSVAKKKGEVFR